MAMLNFHFLGEDGIRRSELVQWYLSEIEDEINSESELMQKKMLVDKVISRLVSRVSRNVIFLKTFNMCKNYVNVVFLSNESAILYPIKILGMNVVR